MKNNGRVLNNVERDWSNLSGMRPVCAGRDPHPHPLPTYTP
jgi:hypothetical protein